ncbi:hypothetical protein E0W68_06870 [Flavobacterium salilacus subsp. salilacus]|uniref:DUF6427 family protein n=1 Tax=Flavobacterium TaxID=237 RepID=UPI0010751B3D|nr:MULTISPECIES: DUF6427 family protein [Flavobacterium]KAF2518973.1 hypothetical protein E0W68_06870 [Flavobacterium salilacus subsp. salilacus]MBE1614864.1 hypothetical protein [Flavobacterium sp. SaA2.13]
MLASVFNKSRPINYVMIAVTLVSFYFLYLFKDDSWTAYFYLILQKTGLLFLLAGSLFLVNFITHKNRLTKDNTYAMFLFMVFLILFPTIIVNTNIIISNFFLLLALRRLISLQSLITPKEKIFDASFWIFAAAIFHFWSIIYIVLVFISIIFHVSRDYRNWIIPFIAFFAVTVLYFMAVLVIDKSFFNHVMGEIHVSFDFTYFENIYQNIAIAFFASVTVLFLFPYIFSISSKPLNLQVSHKKILFSFLIGVGIYVLSDAKNNSFLAFTFAPLAIMGANYLESQKNYWVKETVLAAIVIVSVILFVMQL